MSRHDLPGLNPDHRVVVGWDPPLRTFFAQVIDVAKEKADEEDEDPVLVWAGASAPWLRTVDDVVTVMDGWATISTELQATLQADREREGERTPTFYRVG